MGILDDLIKSIDGEEKPSPEETTKSNANPEGSNANGMPDDWYSDEFKKFAGIE